MAENPIHEYQLENLSCGDCALKIEDAVRKMPEVRFASVNFAAGKLHLDTDDLPAVVSLIQQIEPQVEVLPAGIDSRSENAGPRRDLALITVSAFLFIFGISLNSFITAPWFPWVVFGAAYLISGHRVLIQAVSNLRAGQWFDESFLMSVSTIGAIAIQELPEAVGVMLFYQIGEYIQGRSVARSRRMIQSLMEISPDTALVENEDGSVIQVSPQDVVVGAVIMVRPGDRMPLDGNIIRGESLVDASMLTGESMPVAVSPGSEVFAGTVNQSGELRIQVTRPVADSAASRMLALVEDAVGRKAKTEQFITRFARVYTPIMVGLALGVAVLPPLLLDGQTFQDWIYRALILLVISCPCALVISIPLGYFGGIGAASRRGILVKGANYLDVLARVRTVVFDKTGTLTRGRFQVVEIAPAPGVSEHELLALAARAEGNSTHPLANAVRDASRKKISGEQDFSQDQVEELAGFGRRVQAGDQVILIGNDAILHRENVSHPLCDVGGTVMFIALDGVYQGFLRVDDELKAGAGEAVNALRESGVRHVSMLSGDNAATASRVAEAVGLDNFRAGLLPEDKVSELEKIIARESEGAVAFVGDGINDAAGLARADVGIAMGALGTDAAREAADVVLVTDEISRIAEAITLARRTRRIVWQNIGLALGIKLVFILLGVAGSASMWEAVFADVGVTILAVLNAARVLRA